MTDPLPITPLEGPFEAAIRPPGSKSLTNRVLLLAALADGVSRVDGLLLADDTRIMLEALRELGFRIDLDEGRRQATVHGEAGRIPAARATLDVGNSGTTIRFLTAACATGAGEFTLDGVPRMRQRPIGSLVEPLRQFGARIAYTQAEGYPPIRVDAAGLAGGELTLKPALSSQFISALLMAGPRMTEGLRLSFDGPVLSWPYVSMTLATMGRFLPGFAPLGGSRGEPPAPGEAIRVDPAVYRATDFPIEPDASAASYFLAAAAIRPGSRCTVPGLGHDSVQGDVRFAEVLGRMGAAVSIGRDAITVEGRRPLHGIDVNLNAMPDTAQTLAVVALFADGLTVIRDVGNLRVKETDRLAALDAELSKLGATVRIDGDDLHIAPPKDNRPRPADIATYDDHRMAMAFAVAGLAAEGIRIQNPDCVSKTYPGFFDDLASLGRGGNA